MCGDIYEHGVVPNASKLPKSVQAFQVAQYYFKIN